MTNIDIIQALDNIRINNLYVHNSELEGAKFSNEKLKDRKVYLVETLAVINALVERGTMMLYGGHGGGKTTLSKYLGQLYNPQIQISAESETKRSIFREKDKTKRSKKESAQHSKSRNKSFVMTSVSAL